MARKRMVYVISLNGIFLCAINKIASAWEQDEIGREGKITFSKKSEYFYLAIYKNQIK